MLHLLLTHACASSEVPLGVGKTVQQSLLRDIAVGAAVFTLLLQRSPSGQCCWLAAAGSSRWLLLAVS